MVSVQGLYELWAEDSALDAELSRDLAPRGTDFLFDLFATLGPQPGQLLIDIGARDAEHTIRLVRAHGLHGIALDPVPLHVELARQTIAAAGLDDELEAREGAIESLPLADASADWIWCRDVLVHVDVPRGLAECARVLSRVGVMVAYVTLATELLEPAEEALLTRALALVPDSLLADRVEHAAEAAGLVAVQTHRLGGEWRERMIEDGRWDPAGTLVRLSRLRRREAELVGAFGRDAVDAYVGGKLWGVYQLLGKLCPAIYVWERHA